MEKKNTPQILTFEILLFNLRAKYCLTLLSYNSSWKLPWDKTLTRTYHARCLNCSCWETLEKSTWAYGFSQRVSYSGVKLILNYPPPKNILKFLAQEINIMSLIELRNLHRLLILFLFPIPLCFYAPYFLFLRGKRKKKGFRRRKPVCTSWRLDFAAEYCPFLAWMKKITQSPLLTYIVIALSCFQ